MNTPETFKNTPDNSLFSRRRRIWMSIIIMTWVLLILFLKASEVFAQKKPVADIPALDSIVRTGVLPNGLTYYIRSNKEPKNRAELYLVNKFGSLQEEDDQRGLAHFVEHMAFNGTRDFPKNTLIDYLQKAGVRFGADLNASTNFDATIYQLPLPTDDAALFEKGFDILLNWGSQISLDGKEIDAERGIILEEERLRGKNMNDRMQKKIFPLMMANSRYLDRLPIGTEENLKTFPHSSLKNYYQSWYRPDMQAVIAVGDFDPSLVELLIKNKFSALKNPASPKKLVKYTIPENKKPLVKVVTDVENPSTVASLYYKREKNTVTSKATYKKALIYGMINQMAGSRLEELLQNGTALFIGADASVGGFLGNLDAFNVNIQSSDAKSLGAAVDQVYTEMIRMKKFGFTEGELARARKSTLTSIDRSYKERNKRASVAYVDEYTRHFTDGEVAPGIEREYQLYYEIVPAITLAEVNEVAAGLMTPTNQLFIIEGNDKDKATLPDEKTFLTWVTGDRAVGPYKDIAVDDKLMTTLPTGGSVLSEKKIAGWEATELTLSNGVRVILKPTDFKDDQILFTAFSPGGLSVAPVSTYRSAQYSSAIIAQSGVGAFSQTTLDKMLTGKSVSVGPYVGTYEEGMNGGSTPADMETALQLVYLYFTSPRKDTTAFNTIRKQLVTAVSTRYDNPTAAFSDTLGSVLNNHNFRSKPLTLSGIENISLEAALSFYHLQFSDANDFIFVFTGNINRSTLDPLLCTYIASLPSKKGVDPVNDMGLHPLNGKVIQKVYRGLEDKANVSMNFHGMFAYSEEESMMLEGLKSVLQNKLNERLREKESGVYSPGVSLRVEKSPLPQYRLQVSFTCSSENVDRLVAAVYDEVEQLKKKGIPAEDLEKFKAEEKRQFELKLRQNNFWQSFIKSVYKEEVREQRLQLYPVMLENLSSEKLTAAAKKYFDTDNVATVILLPENIKK